MKVITAEASSPFSIFGVVQGSFALRGLKKNAMLEAHCGCPGCVAL
jgi:hypothetical protein